MKKFIPRRFKHLLWFIFKAPQRGFSKGSLWRDFKGFLVLNFALTKTPLSPITICTGIYNRSDPFLNILIKSLNKCKNRDLITISVCDCGSNDTEDLLTEIKKHWDGNLVYKSIAEPFSRSKSINISVKNAPSQLVFICDADMSVPENLVRIMNRFVTIKRAWFPICFFLFNSNKIGPEDPKGEWKEYDATGMLGCIKSDFLSIGGLNETFTTWGKEDTELWTRFHKQKFVIIRNKQKGLIHHWHKTHNPKYKHMND